MKNLIFVLLGVAMLFFNSAIAEETPLTAARPDGHAPISIMGDHYHKKGELMFSYRSMPMYMNGNLSSSDNISTDEIHKSYMVAPEKMSMLMSMLGVMYAVSDNLTIMVMGNYIQNSMDLKTRSGVNFTTNSAGFGDVTIAGLVKLFNKNRHSLHTNLGFSIPTGSIDQRDAIPTSTSAPLAYAMQLGSGTWDPFVGLTYVGQTDKFSWGAQFINKYRLGKNSEKYSISDVYKTVAWGAYKISNYFSTSASIQHTGLSRIDGADPDLNPAMMPLFNTINSGRNQLDVGLGVNFYVPSGALKNLRLAVEVKFPIYQKVIGIQMKNTFMSTFGIQYALGHAGH